MTPISAPAVPASVSSPGSKARVLALTVLGIAALAAGTSRMAAADASATAAASDATAYGPFGWLDHRSSYGSGDYPEPFLVDDSDLEVNEARMDWLHTSAPGTKTDLVTGEVEKGFGLLTVEIEVPYERDSATSLDPLTGKSVATVTEGMANVDMGARLPILQCISADGRVDASFGVAVEVGVPTHSPVSNNTEVVPKVFSDVKVGENLTLQAIFGYSMLYGSGDGGGLDTFEYGFTFGYNISHKDLPIPGVLRLIPILELSGATEVNKDQPGHNSLLGNLAFRVNLRTIGGVQPRLGLGYVFPVDKGGREDVHQGFVTSLVFEY